MIIKREGTFSISAQDIVNLIRSEEKTDCDILGYLQIVRAIATKITIADIEEYGRNFPTSYTMNADWLKHYVEMVKILSEVESNTDEQH